MRVRCGHSVLMWVLLFLMCFQAGYSREKIALAVLDFDPKNTSKENAEAVTDLLRTELFNAGRFIVVERDQIQQIIDEQQFQMAGYTDMLQAMEIGRLLNVHKILVGTVNKLGETYVLNARMVDIQSGAVELAVSKKSVGGEGNLPDAIEVLGRMIVDRVGIEGAIIRMDGGTVLIDLGSQDGVRPGQAFNVLRAGETIKDLKGRVIGTRFEEVGSIEVTDIEVQFSEARIRQGAGELRLGDKVRSVATEVDLGENYPVEGVWYQIVGMHSEKCIDVAGAKTDNNANIQLYTSHGKANQLWMFVRTGQYYKIISKHSGKCLDLAGNSMENKANIQLYTCHGRDDQLWKLEPVGDYFKIISKHSGKCLDVPGFSKEDGANIQQFSCNGGSNQLWKLEPVEE